MHWKHAILTESIAPLIRQIDIQATRFSRDRIPRRMFRLKKLQLLVWKADSTGQQSQKGGREPPESGMLVHWIHWVYLIHYINLPFGAISVWLLRSMSIPPTVPSPSSIFNHIRFNSACAKAHGVAITHGQILPWWHRPDLGNYKLALNWIGGPWMGNEVITQIWAMSPGQ